MNCAEFAKVLQHGMTGEEFLQLADAVTEHFRSCEPCRIAATPAEEEAAVSAQA